MWFPKRSDTNRPVQAQKQARSLKFWIYKVEELYYPCSKNKGADQLRSYCEADQRLCFRLCRLLVFPFGGSYISVLKFLECYVPTKSFEFYRNLKVNYCKGNIEIWCLKCLSLNNKMPRQ